MTARIQNILRQCGVLVIKLIKRIRNHLYTYILFSTIAALFFSVIIWIGLNGLAKSIFLKDYYLRAEYIKNEIGSKIEDENLTYYEALESIDSLIYNEESIRLVLNTKEKDKFDNKIIFNGDAVYKFPVKYSDGDGTILIKPVIRMIPKYCEYFISSISVFVFMFILFFFVRKPIKYIEEIERNIEIIAGGKLSYKIPIKGNNELTHLADNINEMSSQLKRRIEKEKENEVRQRQLITNISHDLRTPLTVLMGYLDLLKIKAYKTMEESDDFINSAYNKCYQLQELIEDLFTYNKMINGDISVNFEKVEMVSFIYENISLQRLNVNFDSNEKEIFLLIDKKLMIRILDNLFDNIKKYGIDNEQVNVYLKKSENKVILIVENKTNNDLTNKLNNIFERTYVGNDSRIEKSSGLGLSIVAESVKLMKAKVCARFEKPVLQIIIKFEVNI